MRDDLRAGGGTVYTDQTGEQVTGRSPRGRRNLRFGPCAHVSAGTISARAEEPERRATASGPRGDDLRAGGGTGLMMVTMFSLKGRSPRGRRNLHDRRL